MNLRKVKENNEDYNIGLDIGTGSVGWAVVDSQGKLFHFKGKPTWGSRIFESGNTAAETRLKRGQRRRYTRRRWRINLLQQLFDEEMQAVDATFFLRLRYARLLAEDRPENMRYYSSLLFNDGTMRESDYYQQFPTIYHLRKHLIESDKKEDLRFIYLALHNIVKHRGNFLRQNETISAKSADINRAVKDFIASLQDWCGLYSLSLDCADEEAIVKALTQVKATRKEIAEALTTAIKISFTDDTEREFPKDIAKRIAQAIVGLTTDFSKLFEIVGDAAPKIKLSDTEKADVLAESLEDDDLAFYIAIRALYSAYILLGMLKNAGGQTISYSKVEEYNQYGRDLKQLKELVKEYNPDAYGAMFRAKEIEHGSLKDYKEAFHSQTAKTKFVEGYTQYNIDHSATSYEGLKKYVEKSLKNASDNPSYIDMMQRFGEEKFLRRPKTSDNGVIPFQLHLEEMALILDNQGQYYPFLKQNKDKILSLVTFRIPYYVGPLPQKKSQEDNPCTQSRFAWSSRLPGKEEETLYPWNWEDIVDKDASAEAFITRMTGTCTYLYNEPVLPKCSLLYEEFCVLNELNGAWYSDGDKRFKFDARDRAAIVDELFHKGSVSYKKLSDWFKQRGHMAFSIGGGQGESKFESRMSSYIFFSKDIFNTEELSYTQRELAEKIILWNTLFEDRDILKHKIKEAYGDVLSPEQIQKICKKRFTGWGRLSKEFLTGLKVTTDLGDKSIMDVLREGNPNPGKAKRGDALVLMQILRDEDLNFQAKVDEYNKNKMPRNVAIDDLPGSPAIRRSINQANLIVKEIVKIAGKAPKNIFVEVAREDDADARKKTKRGSRTKRRAENINTAVAKLKEENPDLWNKQLESELKDNTKILDSERVYLYFLQCGKSLYSGKPLHIEELSSYEVDHIIPQSYIKDDSIENKALVRKEENQNKSDQMLLPESVRRLMRSQWKAMLDAGLMSKKKFDNLTKSSISENQARGFIARQLVETSQIVKIVMALFTSKYEDEGTTIVPVKASLSSTLRDSFTLLKCREMNNYHHAHDAFLAVELGRYIQDRFPGIYTRPIAYAAAVKKYVEDIAVQKKHGKYMPGSAGFIVGSYVKDDVDKETGEICGPGSRGEYLQKILDYKQCFISRMPVEDTGAFWNETIYSPKKESLIKLKQGLDTAKYGGYSSLKPAYFVLYAGKNKKGEYVNKLTGMPVQIAKHIEEDEALFDAFLLKAAAAEKLTDPVVIRKKLLIHSKIQLDNDVYYIDALASVKSAREIVIPRNILSSPIAEHAPQLDKVDEQKLIGIYKYLVSNGSKIYSKFHNVASVLESGLAEFIALPVEESIKEKIILDVLLYLLGKGQGVCNTKAVGGSQFSGFISNGFLLNRLNEAYIIDQSVTGMFETKTKLVPKDLPKDE